MDANIAHHVSELRTHGYSIIRNAFSAETAAALKASLDATAATLGINGAASRFEGYRTVRIYNLLAHSEAYWSIPLHPVVLGVAEQFLDPECLLSSISAISLGGGEVEQPLHCDTQQIPLPRPHAPIAMNAMWAISDFTEANGATRIIPGSHLRDTTPPYGATGIATVPAEMPAGSIMLFDSALWHAGGANQTNALRYAISNYYCVGWMRQQENQQLGIAQAVAAKMPLRLQQLLGYSVWRGQYGHIANTDPIEMLGRSTGGRMIWDDRRVQELGAAAAKPT